MEFSNLKDLVKVFANEYIKPGFRILVIDGSSSFKEIFEFLLVDSYFVNTGIEVEYDYLPFEDSAFDIVINFNEINNEITRIAQGRILTYGKIINGIEYYQIGGKFFTIL